MGAHHPPSQSDSYCFEQLDKALDIYSNYEKVLLTGDFNSEITEPCIDSFLYQYDMTSLVKEKTCFKSITNPTCIDLFLTNSNLSFQHTEAVSTGLSDFHMLVVTVLKTCFSKKKPRELEYRNYKNFDSVLFNEDLKYMFSQDPVNSCAKFDKIFFEVLDKHARRKTKILQANHSSYVSKGLRKAITKRSSLEKLYFKNRTETSLKTYKRQKNYCS